MLDAFALIVLLVLVAAAIAIVVALGAYPGKVAVEKNHPQADAINYMAWLGLLSFGVLWVLALIWAQVKYTDQKPITRAEAVKA